MTIMAGMEGAQSVFLDALAAIQLVGSSWYCTYSDCKS